MSNSQIVADVRLNLEGAWPRASYLQLCGEQGIEYTEAGYLQWRAVGERLTGKQSFETSMHRATAALESIGLSMANLGHAFHNIIEAQQQHEQDRIQRQRADQGR